ncbi:oligosaccharide repeat unit polymerase [Enterococcus gallinarum]|nr:oligosaccharide repeat unit polymerase [Enterococcus gallinarum]
MPIIFQFLIYYFIYSNIYKISNFTLILYSIGLGSFVCGYFFLSIFIKKGVYIKKNESVRNVNSNYTIVYLFLFIGLICLVLTQVYLRKLGVGVSNFSTESLNIRETFVNNLSNVPFYVTYGKYFLLFSISYFWYDFLTGKKIVSKGTMAVLLFLLFFNAFSVYSRTDLLISILPIFIIFFRIKIKNRVVLEENEKSKIRRQVLVLSIILFSLMFVMNSSRKVEDTSAFFSANNQIMQYIGRPLIAFDQWVVPYSNSSNQLLVFEPLNKVLLALGIFKPLNINLAPKGQFNVYSYLRAPYMDFGVIGIAVIMFVVGIICHYFYLKYKTNNKSWIIFYSIFSYGMIMSFFDWQFFIITFIYLFIYIVLVDKIKIN